MLEKKYFVNKVSNDIVNIQNCRSGLLLYFKYETVFQYNPVLQKFCLVSNILQYYDITIIIKPIELCKP